jgi:hypothetical protein
MTAKLITYNQEKLTTMETEIHEGIVIHPSDTVTDVSLTTSTAGGASNYSRGDHKHKITLPTIPTASTTVPPPISTSAGQIGGSGLFARADHTHYFAGGGGGGPSPSETVTEVSLTTSSAGGSPAFSRGDHMHKLTLPPIPTASDADPSNLGSTPRPGEADTYSRSDHVHQVPEIVIADITEPVVLKNSTNQIVRVLNGGTWSNGSDSNSDETPLFFYVLIPTHKITATSGTGTLTVRIKWYFHSNGLDIPILNTFKVMFAPNEPFSYVNWIEGDYWSAVGVVRNISYDNYIVFKRMNQAGDAMEKSQRVYHVSIEDVSFSKGFKPDTPLNDIAFVSFDDLPIQPTTYPILIDGPLVRSHPVHSLVMTTDTPESGYHPYNDLTMGRWNNLGYIGPGDLPHVTIPEGTKVYVWHRDYDEPDPPEPPEQGNNDGGGQAIVL